MTDLIKIHKSLNPPLPEEGVKNNDIYLTTTEDSPYVQIHVFSSDGSKSKKTPLPEDLQSDVLKGIGRPDKIDTIPNNLKQKVTSAGNGTTYISTDGANVGAWQWIKTPYGWEVSYGDTGWRRVLTEIPLCNAVSGLDLRRVNSVVYARLAPVSNTSGFTLTDKSLKVVTPINFPQGFIQVARTTSAIYSDQGIVGYILIRKGDGSNTYGGRDFYITSTVKNIGYCAWSTSWTANDSYPDTLPGEPVQ